MDDYNEEEAALMEELNKRYFVVAYNNPLILAIFLMSDTNLLSKVSQEGFYYEELEELHDKCIKAGLSFLCVPFKMMKNFTAGQNLKDTFKFVPIKDNGNTENGVLIPEQVKEHKEQFDKPSVILDDRPNNKESIKDEDVDRVAKVTAAFLDGKIDFETFSKLT